MASIRSTRHNFKMTQPESEWNHIEYIKMLSQPNNIADNNKYFDMTFYTFCSFWLSLAPALPLYLSLSSSQFVCKYLVVSSVSLFFSLSLSLSSIISFLFYSARVGWKYILLCNQNSHGIQTFEQWHFDLKPKTFVFVFHDICIIAQGKIQCLRLFKTWKSTMMMIMVVMVGGVMCRFNTCTDKWAK